MRALAREAAAAGALGFATSRLSMHRTADGDAIPSFEAAVDEIVAIGRGFADEGTGIIQIVPALANGSWKPETDFFRAVAEKFTAR